jgi:tetratricopeptide (TPR) repeat protein
MTHNGSSSELERRGLALAEQGRYAEARSLFERVLPTKVMPLHRAQVLRNIMLTYDREGNKARAIETCQEILEIPGLCDTTDGVFLHGQITGYVRHSQGRSFWTSRSFSAVFAAYSAGAAMGAVLGSKVQGSGFTLLGQAVDQDLRYGGAALGALLGFFLFARIAASAGPAMSLIGGIACSGLTAYVLLAGDKTLGFSVLGILVLTPLFLSSLMSALLRNR